MQNCLDIPSTVPNQLVTSRYGVELYIKREDLLHPEVAGNKYRKLKYNLEEAQIEGHTTLLTFGGAYSNHIAATAAAGKRCGFKTIGVIRGDELGEELEKTLRENPSLKFAHTCGMKFKFISRSAYRQKDTQEMYRDLRTEFGNFYLLPEGGSNQLAVQGCQEILTKEDAGFDIICCAVGTGGTMAGIINSSESHQKIIGFPALKGNFLETEIGKYVWQKNWMLNSDYHFGGYAKIEKSLIDFINDFRYEYKIPLDPIYTGKMMYGIFDLLEKGYFQENQRILAVHTGGLQGIAGMNRRLREKAYPLIAI